MKSWNNFYFKVREFLPKEIQFLISLEKSDDSWAWPTHCPISQDWAVAALESREHLPLFRSTVVTLPTISIITVWSLKAFESVNPDIGYLRNEGRWLWPELVCMPEREKGDECGRGRWKLTVLETPALEVPCTSPANNKLVVVCRHTRDCGK